MIKRIGLGAITLGLALSIGAATAQAQAPAHHANVEKRWVTTHYSIAPLCLIERRHMADGHWTKWHILNSFPGKCTS